MKRQVILLAAGIIVVALGAFAAASAHQGIGKGATMAAWDVQWSPPAGGIGANVSAQAAFAAGFRVERVSDYTLHAPAMTRWLAVGPRFGLALVQLDPAGTLRSLVTLEVSAARQVWVENAVGLDGPGPCRADSTPRAGLDGLGLGPVCAIGTTHTPRYSFVDWSAANGQEFVAFRIAAVATRPLAGTETVLVNGQPGWLTARDGITSLVIPLAGGGTFVFVGGANAPETQALAATALRDFDTLTRVSG